MFELHEVIELAIQIERNGEKAYAGAAQAAGREDIAGLLKKLAADERDHVVWFEDPKRTGVGGSAEDSTWDFGRRLLGEILGAQTFSLEEAHLARLDKIREVLEAALEFEKDTILFYRMIQSAVADTAVNGGLEKIIEEENQHVVSLEEFLSDPFKPLDRP